MDYLVKDEELTIQYAAGMGAWTYHLLIPHTAHLKGRWGSLKVSGSIDGFQISCKNLSPRKKSDKLLAINEEIRKAIGKNAGDKVKVSLYLETIKKIEDYKQILLSFEDAQLIEKFKLLDSKKQEMIFHDILSQPDEDKQVEKIIFYIQKLS
ncbi:DUF1905 domain-containing protein [Pedobacter glucosidilyticus]|uniref:DUF1905 domain-containing protein n=1 Tax=Pedobacter glucosidilyticus TaxID=1122941 RepID=UPI0026F031D7|nr:DUF1905 domain-containing protein [Pedobacter glucosidilyticus]